ncbi:MAG TPA: TerC/Alx family metal homeostasis membrane protein [Phycisphaerae bacterium]|nr:TerC/Alx family metal homeostasis membrane protein [Phycisphaerae bacterium]HPU25616.1 TerC/Alx family metal homeostasis membrane protein [Phycisphaerae bacterium]HPZ99667.1 TerC/Alx family metal homeostasis membrane protein [Phycisphaerae bacterium]HQE29554.1 TerC/Alx family metal homeostasis membrane protein [Phycisphaerae bacterium]
MIGVWIAFILLVIGLLALDLGVFHRKSHAIGMREALLWSMVWISLGLLFTLPVYYLYEYHGWGFGANPELRHPIDSNFHPHDGKSAAKMYLSGYLLEKSLSVDNIFVMALIFAYFGVPAIYQHRVLFWGILGALIMRGIMIGAGVTLVQRFTWATYVLGTLLIVTAFKMLVSEEENVHPDRNPLVRAARRFYPVTPTFEGHKFFVRHQGAWAITPMFLVLLVIESTDLLFAVDSIPAVLGITHDSFLVFTSNVFAILGLRALYFALAGLLGQFKYLKVSLVVLLVFIGVKMILARWVHIPVSYSLGVIAGILSVGIIASLVASRSEQLLRAAAYMERPMNIGRAAWRQIRRLVIFVIGTTVALLGVVMLVTPGPAFVVIPLGLLILSYEFVWAKRLLENVKARIRKAAGMSTPPDGPPPHCTKCGYSLHGLTEPRCPECGEPCLLQPTTDCSESTPKSH